LLGQNYFSCPTEDSFPELGNYFLNRKNSDITFVIDGIELPAHKLILSAKSSVFANLLQKNVNDIVLKDIEINAFKALLKYFYRGKFPIENSTDINMIKEVFNLAKKYKVKRLMKTIEESLVHYLNLGNFIEIFEFAIEQSLTDLKMNWRKFVNNNSYDILKDKLYLTNSSYTMECVLYSMRINESQIIDAIKTINESKPDLNMKRFKRIVRINDCTVDDLVSLQKLKLIESELIFDELVNRFKNLEQLQDNSWKSFEHYQLLYETTLKSYESLKECLKQNATACRELYGL